MSDNTSVTIIILTVAVTTLLGFVIPTAVRSWRDVKMAEHGYVQQDLGPHRDPIWVKEVR